LGGGDVNCTCLILGLCVCVRSKCASFFASLSLLIWVLSM
jgi:hypothetical protein